jgi:hypothetical protein
MAAVALSVMNTRWTRTVLAAAATFLLGFAAGGAWGGRGSSSATATSATPTIATTTKSTQAAAVSSPAKPTETPTKEGTGATVTSRRWSEVWRARGDGFRGDPVELAGRVNRSTDKSLLVYGKPDSKEQLAEVYGTYPGVRKNDYVLVKGTIGSGASYDAGHGNAVGVVTIDGVSVSPIGRDRALALAGSANKGEHELGLSRSQGGLRVRLRSIELTAGATRLRVTVANSGSHAARIDVSNAVIQQGPRRFQLSRSDKGARALSEKIRPGASKSKTVTFGRISRKRGKAYVAFDWRSAGGRRNAHKPFEFIMRWKS